MVKVPLTRDLFALVDDEDAYVLKWEWFANKTESGFYAARREAGTRKMVYLHREVMKAPPRVRIDHENHDTLDCRRTNLRFATHSQNTANRLGCVSKYRYKGVRFLGRGRKSKPWRASITFQGRETHIGTFATPRAAAQAYDRKARELFGPFARTNFSL